MISERTGMLPQAAAVFLKFPGGVAHAIVTWSVRVGDTLAGWRERHLQRRSLAKLSGYMLKDIGLSRSEAAREVGKRFWQT